MWGFSVLSGKVDQKENDASKDFNLDVFKYLFIPIICIFAIFILGLSFFHIYLRIV